MAKVFIRNRRVMTRDFSGTRKVLTASADCDCDCDDSYHCTSDCNWGTLFPEIGGFSPNPFDLCVAGTPPQNCFPATLFVKADGLTGVTNQPLYYGLGSSYSATTTLPASLSACIPFAGYGYLGIQGSIDPGAVTDGAYVGGTGLLWRGYVQAKSTYKLYRDGTLIQDLVSRYAVVEVVIATTPTAFATMAAGKEWVAGVWVKPCGLPYPVFTSQINFLSGCSSPFTGAFVDKCKGFTVTGTAQGVSTYDAGTGDLIPPASCVDMPLGGGGTATVKLCCSPQTQFSSCDGSALTPVKWYQAFACEDNSLLNIWARENWLTFNGDGKSNAYRDRILKRCLYFKSDTYRSVPDDPEPTPDTWLDLSSPWFTDCDACRPGYYPAKLCDGDTILTDGDGKPQYGVKGQQLTDGSAYVAYGQCVYFNPDDYVASLPAGAVALIPGTTISETPFPTCADCLIPPFTCAAGNTVDGNSDGRTLAASGNYYADLPPADNLPAHQSGGLSGTIANTGTNAGCCKWGGTPLAYTRYATSGPAPANFDVTVLYCPDTNQTTVTIVDSYTAAVASVTNAGDPTAGPFVINYTNGTDASGTVTLTFS